MAIVQQVIKAPVQQVWAVLADGWTYSDWVVGTAHMRNVDDGWPAVGTRLHHRAGPWPFSLEDSSLVLECEPERKLVLRVKLWPAGEAIVVFALEPVGPDATRVSLGEDFAAGPLRWVRNKLNDLVLHQRNKETLNRLSDIARRQKTPD
ncbi:MULTISPECIES: SRPBCC family protein [Micromonospora]|uniref:Polyketide cyclase n=1 Tax=Micromonospora maris TaxID=1003110 RepID=A0A9X0LGE5_9ACTN|nr:MULTISPECIES: SRPBCC family protein [Micromonospora]AEB43977.1 polyketide cyclase/dehydrase [Micromonospora maris AB-18-032]KUJ49216.1 polyketide cyclase [Micromonospora maris]RUL91342.1 SRPBCC family protein [Verrucosispora sp. FIM060022]